MFHKHKWEVGRETYNPPTERKVEVRGASEHELLKYMYGITTTELKCAACGDRKYITRAGK